MCITKNELFDTTKGNFKFALDTFERTLINKDSPVRKRLIKNLLVYSEKCPPTSSVEHLVRHQFVSNVSNDETHTPPLQNHPVSECALVAILN